MEDMSVKKIECIVPNHKFPLLEKALRERGVPGMTVSEVKGYGNEQTRPEPYLFLPKTKIELYCRDEDLDILINTISDVCKTGQLGDGKIVVFDVEDMLRIRTGERGEVAV